MYWVVMYDVQCDWNDKLKPISESIMCGYIRNVLRFKDKPRMQELS